MADQEDLNRLLTLVEKLGAEVDHIKREQFKTRMLLDQIGETIRQEFNQISASSRETAQQVADKRVVEGELLEKRQEVVAQKAKALEWQNRAVDFLKSLENALSLSELDARYRKAIEKNCADFQRIIAPLGLDVISPQPGDPFEERWHTVTSEEGSAAFGSGRIVRCVSWGFRSGDQVLQPAEVVIAKRADASEPVSAQSRPRPDQGVSPDRKWYQKYLWDFRWAAIFVLAGLVIYLSVFRKPQVENVAMEIRPDISEGVKPEIQSAVQEKQQVIPSNRPSESWPTHRVQAGDSLWQIAVKYYGDGRLADLLISANRLRSNKIHPGMTLVIPGGKRIVSPDQISEQKE